MSEKQRPVLWKGEFVCTCGHRAQAEVFGRRGHQYDEIEKGGDEDDPFIRENYEAEGRGVLALFACPKCGTRPGLGRELRRLGIWLAVLTVSLALAALMFLWLANPGAALAMGLAYGIAVLARAYAFGAAIVESKDRVRLTSER